MSDYEKINSNNFNIAANLRMKATGMPVRVCVGLLVYVCVCVRLSVSMDVCVHMHVCVRVSPSPQSTHMFVIHDWKVEEGTN